MILIVNVCKEKLGYYEFVKPVENILINLGERFVIKHYSELKEQDLDKADKVIICGTSLADNQYMKSLKKFNWILKSERPILGICAGMQIISSLYGCKLKKGGEIGMQRIYFEREFLGLRGDVEAYALHNFSLNEDNKLKQNFEIYGRTNYIQAIKKNGKELYGTLFHPEVRQKELIINFIRIKKLPKNS